MPELRQIKHETCRYSLAYFVSKQLQLGYDTTVKIHMQDDVIIFTKKFNTGNLTAKKQIRMTEDRCDYFNDDKNNSRIGLLNYKQIYHSGMFRDKK